MQIYDTMLADSLAAARDGAVAPVWFLWVVAKDRSSGEDQPVGLWGGDEDITLTMEQADGTTVSRTYVGGCNLDIPDGIPYVADLTDNPVTVTMSQIADTAQLMVRGYDVRLSYCEIHATTWTGGALTSIPQLQWVGIIDEAPITTPATGSDNESGSDGGISLTIRSEIMSMLTATNPAKSSDAQQQKRLSGDLFCKYAGTIESWNLQWYNP